MPGNNGIFSGASAINIHVDHLFSNEAVNQFIDVFEKFATGMVSNLSASMKTTKEMDEMSSSSDPEDSVDTEYTEKKKQKVCDMLS